jgi:hypothetical protein
LDPVEKAIRSALDKGNAADRAFREKVYRAAFAALERATQSQPQLTVEMAIKRRQNLQAKVTGIEAEYLPQPAPTVELDDMPGFAVDPDDAAYPVAVAPDVDVSADPGLGTVGHAPDISLDHAPQHGAGVPDIDLGSPVHLDPAGETRPLADEVAAEDMVAPDRDQARAYRRRRPVAAMFLVVTLLSMAVIGAWWAYQNGIFSGSARDVPNPPQLVEEEEFDPAEEQPGAPGDLGTRELRNWTMVFTPEDLSTVNAPSGATAEAGADESGEYLRIRSGESGAAVVFDVPQSVLEEIVGKKAVFNVSARAEEGGQTQISISCDFGELGDCGRKRYAVGYERGEYLFDVSLPGNQPGAAGSIAINSDFANEGKAVDIYEIRVSVVEEP